MRRKTPISDLSKGARAALVAARVCHLCGEPAVEEWRKKYWCRECMIAEGGDSPLELQTRTKSSLAGE